MKFYSKHHFTRRGIRFNDRNNSQINYETAIKGTTLDVYFFLLRKKESAGVREVQRTLGLSSPSVSSYHLEKLEALEVIRRNRFGNYEISKKIDIGALNQFIIIRNFTLPRFLFYAVFISIMFSGYLLFFLTFPLSTGEIFATFFGF
ncbi:MAG: winged helix-turn-helix transcriptional regulator, partial [Candidatus Heimdallarchaeota archaeon]|nr:winged helix-turn-helix transcriptional regulator [Candidatus Heimdallarchaeota archaeon]